jgi:hypothetical protein
MGRSPGGPHPPRPGRGEAKTTEMFLRWSTFPSWAEQYFLSFSPGSIRLSVFVGQRAQSQTRTSTGRASLDAQMVNADGRHTTHTVESGRIRTSSSMKFHPSCSRRLLCVLSACYMTRTALSRSHVAGLAVHLRTVFRTRLLRMPHLRPMLLPARARHAPIPAAASLSSLCGRWPLLSIAFGV